MERISNSLNDLQLRNIQQNTRNLHLKTAITIITSGLFQKQLLCCFENNLDKNRNIYLFDGEKNLGSIGTHLQSIQIDKKELSNGLEKPYLLNLNPGSFGLDSSHNKIGLEYYKNQDKFLNYLKSESDKAAIINLQDLPNDTNLFNKITSLGYDIFYFTNLYYSEGSFKTRPNTGIASLINKNIQDFDLNFNSLSISFHQGCFPDYKKAFPKYLQTDLLFAPCTIYFSFENKRSKEVYLTASTYVPAFSSPENRKKSILDSVNILNEIRQEIMTSKPGNKIVTRFTGDFNLYGYQTHYGPFGLPAEPFAHLPAAVSGLLTGFKPFKYFQNKTLFQPGLNIPNMQELKNVKESLRKIGYIINSDIYGEFLLSKTVDIDKMAPTIVRPLFKGSKVSWVLDLCISPESEGKIIIYHDLEPFGNTDHKTLVVSL